MKPPSEMVHWLFATGFLLLGLFLLAEALAGQEAWAKRRWRLYLWPGFAFGLGVLMWPVMAFFTSSAPPAAISACAHAPWASMCTAELVKNAITGHISTPSPNAKPGQR